MPTFDENGVPQYPSWKGEALDALYDQFKMLDESQEGVGRHQLRTFYPYLGWNDIQQGLDGLISSNRVEAKQTYVNGKAVEVFVWKAV